MNYDRTTDITFSDMCSPVLKDILGDEYIKQLPLCSSYSVDDVNIAVKWGREDTYLELVVEPMPFRMSITHLKHDKTPMNTVYDLDTMEDGKLTIMKLLRDR